MKERTKKILLASVENFIKYGKPITSERLFQFYDFGIKPAMIRWELNSLSKEGYLIQYHPSGGRYPTNKAYRFFVNYLYDKDFESMIGSSWEWLARMLVAGEIKAFVDTISKKMGVLGMAYKMEKQYLYLNGLYDLCCHLDVDSEDLLSLIRDFEVLPQKIISQRWQDYISSILTKKPMVFIGRNKLIKSDAVSIFVDDLDLEDDRCLLLMIGPKRINYGQLIGLLKFVSRIKENK